MISIVAGDGVGAGGGTGAPISSADFRWRSALALQPEPGLGHGTALADAGQHILQAAAVLATWAWTSLVATSPTPAAIGQRAQPEPASSPSSPR